MNGDSLLYQILDELKIDFDYYEHPPAHTIGEAMKYWKDIAATHCKNLFFRNHKGNRHYLVIIDHRHNLGVHELEQRLRQGKLTFASPERMKKFLGVTPGSVTPFGLIHDTDHHIHLFIDSQLRSSRHISFHPCANTASIVITWSDFLRFLDFTNNSYEFLDLY